MTKKLTKNVWAIIEEYGDALAVVEVKNTETLFHLFHGETVYYHFGIVCYFFKIWCHI